MSSTPEFDDWKWVSYWYPIRQVIAFKRDVYRKAMKEFSLPAFTIQSEVEEPVTNLSKKKRFNFFAHKRKNKQRVKK